MGDLKTAEWFNNNFGPHVNTAALDLLAEIADLRAKLAEATAACAEMRAALDAVAAANTRRMGESRRAIEAVRALLSRTDLGRGWVGPEGVALLRKKLAGASIAIGLGNAGQAFELIDEARALLGDKKDGG